MCSVLFRCSQTDIFRAQPHSPSPCFHFYIVVLVTPCRKMSTQGWYVNFQLPLPVKTLSCSILSYNRAPARMRLFLLSTKATSVQHWNCAHHSTCVPCIVRYIQEHLDRPSITKMRFFVASFVLTLWASFKNWSVQEVYVGICHSHIMRATSKT